MIDLRIADIRTDGGTQSRVQLDWIAVSEYAAAMKDGAQFPPVVVFHDGAEYWLADGFHRVRAAENAGLNTVAADVRQGTRRDAVLFSVGANSSHGVRRTNADKRAAVLLLLNDGEWALWSDSEIARRCGVSSNFVGDQRRIINPIKDTPRKVERNGVTYAMNTAAIGRGNGVAPTTAPTIIFPPTIDDPDPMPLPNPDSVREARAFMEARGEEVFTCPVCGDIFDREVWHCPACHHHWLDGRDYCANCYSPRPGVAVEEDEPESPALAPVAARLPVSIYNADAQQIHALGLAPVHLVVTSPPYNVGIDYDMHADNLSTYFDLLQSVWRQCFDVLEDGGRMAVVVPFGVGRNPWIPLAAKVMDTLTAVGFTLRGQIIWDKNTSGNRTSWGSFRMATDPSLRDTTEAVIVAHKGASKLDVPAEHKGHDEKGTFTPFLADSDYFMELAQDHWIVAPESAQRVKHPAPFPVELVRRLIHFYAFPGAHILDPFAGSGTTGVAAQECGCRASLVELSAEYCALAQERLGK